MRAVTQPSKRQTQIKLGIRHLRKADPVMRRVIDHVGPCHWKCNRDRFWMLVSSILSQQISTAAARTVKGRVVELIESSSGSKRVTPASLLSLSPEQLRTAGVSGRKSEYLLDLASKVDTGEVKLSTIGRLPNEAVIDSLIQIRGIGRWTAEMFLMFSLGRLDVFPVDDLGIRNAMCNLYELNRSSPNSDLLSISEPWQPYASIASWYCWRSLEIDIQIE